ncbi:hypothetical protein STXM2123_4388 [Streptomyces sp. F-3]|nr:hypothetical protein STXM2123_4388 [Streptomyces sp. F-3]
MIDTDVPYDAARVPGHVTGPVPRRPAVACRPRFVPSGPGRERGERCASSAEMRVAWLTP